MPPLPPGPAPCPAPRAGRGRGRRRGSDGGSGGDAVFPRFGRRAGAGSGSRRPLVSAARGGRSRQPLPPCRPSPRAGRAPPGRSAPAPTAAPRRPPPPGKRRPGRERAGGGRAGPGLSAPGGPGCGAVSPGTAPAVGGVGSVVAPRSRVPAGDVRCFSQGRGGRSGLYRAL